MNDSPTRGRGPGPDSEPSIEAEERQLFLQALENLEAVPDKDRPSMRGAGPHKVKKNKPSKNRQFNIQDRLDLHGKNAEEALWRLHQFVVGCSVRRVRNVLVVTGKGLHSKQGMGVLKQATESWILGAGRAYVESYSEAPRRHGGSGALILQLRGAKA